MHPYIWQFCHYVSHHKISRQLSYWSYLGLQTEGREKLVVYPVSHVDQVIARWSHKIRRKLDRTTFSRCQAGRRI